MVRVGAADGGYRNERGASQQYKSSIAFQKTVYESAPIPLLPPFSAKKIIGLIRGNDENSP